METDLKHQYRESPQTRACSFTITVMWTNDTKGVYFPQWSTALIACHRLLTRSRTTFLNLDYSVNLINSSINEFLHNIDNISAPDEDDGTSNIVVPIPFKDQNQLTQSKEKCKIWAKKLECKSCPSFSLRRSAKSFPRKKKPPIVNNQCVVYKFQCDLCDIDYVEYTTRHLHQGIGEHKHSAIGRH